MSGVTAAREKALKAQEERTKELISQLQRKTFSTHRCSSTQRKTLPANSKVLCSPNPRKTVPPNLKFEIRASRDLELGVKFP